MIPGIALAVFTLCGVMAEYKHSADGSKFEYLQCAVDVSGLDLAFLVVSAHGFPLN